MHEQGDDARTLPRRFAHQPHAKEKRHSSAIGNPLRPRVPRPLRLPKPGAARRRQYLDTWAVPKRTRLPDASARAAADDQDAGLLGESIAISADGDIRGGGEERKCQWRQQGTG